MSEFLSRWSRLKRGEMPPEAPAELPPGAAPVVLPEVLPVVLPPAGAAVPEEPAFDVSLLPSLQELTAETDIRGFLHRAVPAGLRNAALKRMWALDPAIRDFVGPVDYAWDFNDPAGIPGITEALGGDVTELLARAIGAAPQPDVAIDAALSAPQPEVSTEAVALAEPPAMPTAALPAVDETILVRRRHGSARPI